MLGSDYPFPIGDQEPRSVIESAEFSEGDMESMLTGNARRLFGL
jgi:predicted TIM-barrel fold metal-dependent hydrolase